MIDVCVSNPLLPALSRLWAHSGQGLRLHFCIPRPAFLVERSGGYTCLTHNHLKGPREWEQEMRMRMGEKLNSRPPARQLSHPAFNQWNYSQIHVGRKLAVLDVPIDVVGYRFPTWHLHKGFSRMILTMPGVFLTSWPENKLLFMSEPCLTFCGTNRPINNSFASSLRAGLSLFPWRAFPRDLAHYRSLVKAVLRISKCC